MKDLFCRVHLSRMLACALFLASCALQSGFAEMGITSETNTVTSPDSVRSYKPFSRLAVGVNFGTLGAGIEAATPLSRKTNLRVDSDFFNYNLSFAQSGIQYDGDLHIRSTRVVYDFFPFGKSFRFSSGIAMYNNVNVDGNGLVPSGSSVTLNRQNYYSSTAAPLHGNESIFYGRKVAPVLTFGWGNAIPRTGRHWAFPVELGAAFTGSPSVDLNVAGNGCTSLPCTVGTPVSSLPGFASNLAAERTKIQNDVAPLRVYPILNFGVTYRF